MFYGEIMLVPLLDYGFNCGQWNIEKFRKDCLFSMFRNNKVADHQLGLMPFCPDCFPNIDRTNFPRVFKAHFD